MVTSAEASDATEGESLTFIDKLVLMKIVHKLQVYGGKKRHELSGWNMGKMVDNKGFCVLLRWDWRIKRGPPRGGVIKP